MITSTQLHAHVLAMAIADKGWHAYALDQAERYVRQDPLLHGGLVARVEAAIGKEATAAARKALEWFAGKGKA